MSSPNLIYLFSNRAQIYIFISNFVTYVDCIIIRQSAGHEYWKEMLNMKRIYMATAAAVLAAFALVSCIKIDNTSYGNYVRDPDLDRRSATTKSKRLLLYYAAGFNNLSGYISEDISQLCSGYLPSQLPNDAVLLIFSHLYSSPYNFKVPSSPVLERVYRDMYGSVVRDTLLTFPAGTLAASANTLREVLEYVKENFDSREYGMIFSSHATGWLPAVRKEEVESPSASPLSVGNEYGPDLKTYEMDITDFAEALPMNLDFILFDACFMGGIEVAYELKDKCRKIAFSQAEVLADGFDYTTMTEYLLKPAVPDLYGVCKAYYEHYASMSGEYQSATVSLVDCGKLFWLAYRCKDIFESHRDIYSSIDPDDIQCFGRIPAHEYFYDLEDLMWHLGATEYEMARFHEDISDCVLYKAATRQFIDIPIEHFCGLSSYVPNKGTYDSFYRTLKWNEDTGMID